MVRWLILVAISATIFATRARANRPAHDRVAIPAGPFTAGSTRGDEDERPVRKVTVKAFAIDRTEVTRGDYAACVAAGRCKATTEKSPADGSDARLPVTGV